MFTRKAIKGWLTVAVFGLLCASSLQAQQPVAAQGSGVQNTSDAAWTTSTGSNTAVTLISNTAIYNSILVTLIQGTTISAGAVTFEMSTDNSAWIGVQGVAVGTTALMGPSYTLVASTNAAFLFPVTRFTSAFGFPRPSPEAEQSRLSTRHRRCQQWGFWGALRAWGEATTSSGM